MNTLMSQCTKWLHSSCMQSFRGDRPVTYSWQHYHQLGESSHLESNRMPQPFSAVVLSSSPYVLQCCLFTCLISTKLVLLGLWFNFFIVYKLEVLCLSSAEFSELNIYLLQHLYCNITWPVLSFNWVLVVFKHRVKISRLY